MSLDSLEKLFLEELKDVYNAEKQILRALPKMAKAADSPELEQAFTKHLKETQGQVQRLERIFKELGQTARGKKCKGMEGLLEEGKEVLEALRDCRLWLSPVLCLPPGLFGGRTVAAADSRRGGSSRPEAVKAG